MGLSFHPVAAKAHIPLSPDWGRQTASAAGAGSGKVHAARPLEQLGMAGHGMRNNVRCLRVVKVYVFGRPVLLSLWRALEFWEADHTRNFPGWLPQFVTDDIGDPS